MNDTVRQMGEDEDAVPGEFLRFLARDMRRHPARLQGLDSAIVTRVRALVENVDVDLDQSLSPEDD